MTAEELALLGYQPGQTASPALNAAQAFVTPQDLQQFAAMAGNPGAGAPDPASVYQLPAGIDMAALDSIGALPPSDPNGFTSNQPFVGSTPSGQPVVLPPGPAQAGGPGVDPSQIGSASDTSPANGQFAPGSPQDTPQQSQQSSNQAPANQNLATSLGFPQFADWAKASGLPRQVMPEERKVILEKYLDQQKDFMARQDPAKVLQLKKDQVELDRATTEQADAVAKKVDAIPEVENNIKLLDELVTHKGLSSSVGAKDAAFLFGLKSEPLAGTDAANFMERVKQVQGKNFLTAFQQLKGAGQITEVEGAKAQAALGRLGTNQSEDEFKNSVAELRGILQTGLDRSKARLGTQGQVAPAASKGSNTSSSGAPVLRTTARGTFRSIGNGQWVQIK
jgi:hypothetical protein